MYRNEKGGGTTSQKAKYAVKELRVNRPNLRETMKEMVKQLDAEILQQREFKIYRDTLPVRGTCLRLKDAMYPVDVYINSNGELEVNGDEMDIQNVVKKVKQFYKAVNIARLTGARIQYNKEKRKVRLRMQVR